MCVGDRRIGAVCCTADLLGKHGFGLNHAAFVHVYVSDMAMFSAVNAAYGGFFAVDPPSRCVLSSLVFTARGCTPSPSLLLYFSISLSISTSPSHSLSLSLTRSQVLPPFSGCAGRASRWLFRAAVASLSMPSCTGAAAVERASTCRACRGGHRSASDLTARLML